MVGRSSVSHVDHLEEQDRRVQQARDAAAEGHEDAAQFWDEDDDDERAAKERQLAQKDREGWRLEGERGPLSGERDAAHPGEGARELGEDR